MRKKLLVTVFMPVYNGSKYLRPAIDSVLNQTFKDFELLIINDGSTDNSVEIIKTYQDPRIRLLHNKRNIGLSRTRNRGFAEAKGKYMAFLDCDDIALPKRLGKQVHFLEKNPKIGMCGTWIKTIGDRPGNIWKQPLSSDEIKCTMLFHGAFCNSTIMLRTSLIKKYKLKFNLKYPPREDWGLWIDCGRYTELANIPEILVYYRYHLVSTSRQKALNALGKEYLVDKDNLKRLGLTVNKKTALLHRSLEKPELVVPKTIGYIQDIEKWLLSLQTANQKKRIYPEKAFVNLLREHWLEACYTSMDLGFWAYQKYKQSIFSKRLSVTQSVKFLVKTLLHRHHRENSSAGHRRKS